MNMKKIVSLLAMCFRAVSVFAQTNKTEVLYFKAQLACCQANACNTLENDIKQIVTKNFPKDVAFKQVALADENNKALVEKHKAKSQTVVLVNSKGAVDVSDIVRAYVRSSDKDAFEKALVAKIQESIK